MSGVYAFPGNVSAGAFVRYLQGYPYVLFAEIPDDKLINFNGIGQHRFLVEPIGSRRYDNIFTVDFQVQRTFTLGKYGNLTGLLTIFNLTNKDTVTSRANRVGSSRLNEVTQRLEARSYRFAIRYGF